MTRVLPWSSLLRALTPFIHGASLVTKWWGICCQPKKYKFNPWVMTIPQWRKWQPVSVFLPGKSHGQWSLVGYSPWSYKSVRHDLVTKQQQQSHSWGFCPHDLITSKSPLPNTITLVIRFQHMNFGVIQTGRKKISKSLSAIYLEKQNYLWSKYI